MPYNSSMDYIRRFIDSLKIREKKSSQKRSADEQPEYSVNKYRRVSSNFPKYISKPFEDDVLFIDNSHKEQNRMAQGSSNNFSTFGQLARTTTLKKNKFSKMSTFADIEFSDDDDDDIVLSNSSKNDLFAKMKEKHFQPNSTQNYEKLKQLRFPNSFNKSSIQPPALIEKRKVFVPTQKLSKLDLTQKPKYPKLRQSMLSNGNTHADELSLQNLNINGSVKTSNIPNNSSLINSSKLKPINSLISESYNIKQKASYFNLLSRVVPSLYKTTDSDKKSVSVGKSIEQIKSSPTVDLEDDEEVIKEIDLSVDDDMEITYLRRIPKNRSDRTKFDETKIERVNSLKDQQLSPRLKETWLTSIREKYDAKGIQRKKDISEQEEKFLSLTNQRESFLIPFEDRIKTALLEKETIILDEPEVEIEFPKLTEENLTLIQNLLYNGSQEEVLISKFNIMITRHDLTTLSGDRWLNDSVINFYMNLLIDRGERRHSEGLPKVYAFNTFFTQRLQQSGYSGVRRWTKKINLFSYDIIPVPVHVGGVHWCMAIINLKSKTIKYYDSMGKANPGILNALLMYLREESLDKLKETLDTSEYNLESVSNVPRQMNGSDCGVFSCMFAEYVTRNRDITFSQKHMPYFRQKMIYEIAKGALML